MFNLSPQELKLFRSLNTPQKVQDFLDQMPINKEKNGDTCRSPRKVLQENKAQCMEGAMLAAAILRVQGRPPLVLSLESTKDDFDHVIAIFKEHNHWGAISKTNHAVLRYRDPIYRTVRELVMTYFDEYFDSKGKKNLRTYSKPINLSRFDKLNWMTSKEDIWYIPEYLCDVPHTKILTQSMLRTLRKAQPFQVKTYESTEW
ncbi:MAG: hypothetical protein AABX70_03180 [Nanoarchaeota archaeon]